MTPQYRKSIWRHNKRYDIDHRQLQPQDFEVIGRLLWVNAAKMQATPIPPHNLLGISKAAKSMPPIKKATTANVANYIKNCRCPGGGIKTLMCMLAVETEGKYPPMDRKFAAGLLARKKVTPKEFMSLESNNPDEFAEIYVRKVIPAWIAARRTRSPKAADNYFAAANS